MKNLFNILTIIFLIFYTNTQYAKEILIYADAIQYDKEKNVIAKGNAKIISGNKILFSDLIIFNQEENIYILPNTFQFKDDQNNYYFGSSGSFSRNLNESVIEDVKIQLNDGSRIVGKRAKREGKIDIISKGVYSPCQSRIKVGNFICPTWQLEGEKILHNSENLFLYQKHSKMRVVNTPVFYLPYLVTPSPLRKERKSGFLSPSLGLTFFDVNVSQTTSLPYYFNLAQDKELTFTPVLNYGGGVDSSQRFIFDYNQIISGGTLNFDFQVDTTLEKENSDNWLQDGLLITNYEKNLNEKFKLKFNSTLQTSNNYIQTTNPTNELSYASSLKTAVDLEGYNLNKIDDKLYLNVSTYQVNQNNENNKNIPTVLPYFEYNTGKYVVLNNDTNHELQFYNIFRDKATDVHSQQQFKIGHVLYTNYEFINYNSNISFKTETHNQFYRTENKLIEDSNVSGDYYRIFPIAGIFVDTPFRFINDKNNFVITPNVSLVVSPGASNSDKISNEISTNSLYSITNNSNLNRYTGSDKLDNSKRVNYGISSENDKIKLTLSQSYEFTENSNYHNEQGNDDKLSDLLGEAKYNNNDMIFGYKFRYDPDINVVNRQEISLEDKTYIGKYYINYLNEKSITNNNITNTSETVTYTYTTNKIKKFSEIQLNGHYDLETDNNKEYGVKYSYFDECFGINLDFSRQFYSDKELKPADTLTLMFSFKNVGSYKSTNLAVSESDKQEIEWLSYDLDNELFN